MLILAILAILKNNRNYQQGLSLIEVIFATGILMLLLIAIVTALALSVRNAQTAKNRSRAEKLAREQMERIRAFRDRNGYDKLSCDDTSGCYIDGSLKKNSGQKTNSLDIDYTIYFKIEIPGSCPTPPTGANQIKEVTVTVEWLEGRGTQAGGAGLQTVKVTSCFTNWRALP